MPLEHLRGRKVCDRVLRLGKVWKGKHMLVRYIAGAPRHPHADPARPALYIGTIASTKLDKSAVVRNRMRRRCREAWRIVVTHRDGQGLPPQGSIQLLIAPRSSSLHAPFTDLQREVSQFLSSLSHV